jgi:GNAT superfamily N-acetyltransferase
MRVWVHPNAREMRAQWSDRKSYHPSAGDAPTTLLVVQRCAQCLWNQFKDHHYLTSKLMISSRCYIGSIDGIPCGFVAAAASPGMPWSPTKANPNLAHRHAPGKSRWRESRLVVLPEYQNLGVGRLLSETVASIYVSAGHQYYSRTAHPKLTRSRMRASSSWHPTGTVTKVRKRTEWPSNTYHSSHTRRVRMKQDTRPCHTFQYTGTPLDGRYVFRRIDHESEGVCPACNTIVTTTRDVVSCANCRAVLPATRKGNASATHAWAMS